MLREEVKEILEQITKDSALEAKWLNTLSLMEYIGARKITRTVCDTHPPLDILDHWADEARHAYAFKRLALEVGGGTCEEYLSPKAAMTYFQKLDATLSAWITELTGKEDKYNNYLLVTTLIERRAMMLYPLYRSISQNEAVRDELRQIITEEADHRVAIEENMLKILEGYGVSNLSECESLEQGLLKEFLTALKGDIARELGTSA